ncbi:MAG: PucR family transcriptional regulator ligand-binding domain-containing protein, partial [Acidimicrobiia bacterium]
MVAPLRNRAAGRRNPSGGFTVRDALALDALGQVRVVAGKGGLERSIRWVHILDIPDMVPWVSEGDLVITNAYAFSKDPSSMERLVLRLDDKDVAGLMVGTGLFIDAIPQHMTEEADARGFPLLEVPWRVRFEDLTLQLTQAILGFQYEVLQRVRIASQDLLQAALAEGFEKMAGVLDEALHRPVVFLDGRGDPVAGSEIMLIRTVKLHREVLDDKLTHCLQALGNAGMEEELEFPLADVQVRLHPVSVGDRLLGAIVLEASPPLSGAESLILSVGSTVVALEFMQREHPSREAFERRREFLDDLIAGATQGYPSIEARSEAVGWSCEQSFVIGVLDVDDFSARAERLSVGDDGFHSLQRRMLGLARMRLPPWG